MNLCVESCETKLGDTLDDTLELGRLADGEEVRRMSTASHE